MTASGSRPYLSPHDVTAAWGTTAGGKTVRIVVDAHGGDNAPEEVVAGVLDVAGPSTRIILVGDEGRVRPLIPAGAQHISLVHAGDVIGCEEEPARAARNKVDSSIVVGLNLVHTGEADAFVSAGSTGAVVAASLLYVRRVPGVKRPAICTIMPCMPSPIAFLDVGANAEFRPDHLRQFALMGQVFSRVVMGIDEPVVGLLSIGEERTKGTPELVEAHGLIAADERIRFYGNIEGRDIMNRTVDVVVTDGFTGNVALKTIEGTAHAILKALRETIDLSLSSKIGGLLLRRDLMAMRGVLDPNEFGGAVLIGVRAPVIIAHGNSTARGIAQAIRMGHRAVAGELLSALSVELGA